MRTLVTVKVALVLLNTLCGLQPTNPVLRELLDPRLQLRLVEIEVIHGSNTWNAHTRRPAALAIHQCPTNGTEEVCHCVAGINSVGLGKFGELVLPADVCDGGGLDDEVRGEHRGCDLACRRVFLSASRIRECGRVWMLTTVGTVADERVNQILARNWLHDM